MKKMMRLAMAAAVGMMAVPDVRAHDMLFVHLWEGVRKSADDGATWTLLKSTPAFLPAGFTSTKLNNPRFEPVSGTIFVGSNATKTLAADARGFLFSSSDFGVTWSQAAGPSDVPGGPA